MKTSIAKWSLTFLLLEKPRLHQFGRRHLWQELGQNDVKAKKWNVNMLFLSPVFPCCGNSLKVNGL